MSDRPKWLPDAATVRAYTGREEPEFVANPHAMPGSGHGETSSCGIV